MPFGERIAVGPVTGWEIFPYEGELRGKVLASRVVPEPPRAGAGGVDCSACDAPDDAYLWTNADWRIKAPAEPAAVPGVLLVETRAHHDLTDLPADLAGGLGPILQKAERALLSLGGVARVHVNRWGDGAEHLHLWLWARPEGMMQLRGVALPLWDDALPKQSPEQWSATLGTLRGALAG